MRTRRPAVQAKRSAPVTKPDGRQLAILGFHKIGEPAAGGWETWFYIPEATFVEHLS